MAETISKEENGNVFTYIGGVLRHSTFNVNAHFSALFISHVLDDIGKNWPLSVSDPY